MSLPFVQNALCTSNGEVLVRQGTYDLNGQTTDTHGQVPHPVGIWTESNITSPPLKENCDCMRIDMRFPVTCGVVSTRMIAFPALLIDERLFDN